MPSSCTCGCKNSVTYPGQIAGKCPRNTHLTKVQKREHNDQFFPVDYHTKQDKRTDKSNANKSQAAAAAKTMLAASPGLTDAVLTADLEKLGHSSASINAYKSTAKSNANASAKRNKQVMEQLEECSENLPDGNLRTRENAVSLGLDQAAQLFENLRKEIGDPTKYLYHAMLGKQHTMYNSTDKLPLETVITDKKKLLNEVYRGFSDDSLVNPRTGEELKSDMKEFVKKFSIVGVASAGDNVVSCNAMEGELGSLGLASGFSVSCDNDLAAKRMSMGGARNYYVSNGQIWNNYEESEQMRDDRKRRKVAFKDEYAANIVPGPQVVGLIILPIDESRYMLRKDWNKRPAENDTDEDDRMEKPKRRRISESSDESGDEC